MRIRHRLVPLLILLGVGAVSGPLPAVAQPAAISGFVTDESSGYPMELVNIVLFQDDSLAYGTATNRDGLYLLTQIAPGAYLARVSFIGYLPIADTLVLRAGERHVLNVALRPDQGQLEEVVVEAERSTLPVSITAGQQTIRPADLERVPSPDVAGDLISYLTTLPGVISSGDRGGQLFIRGGEPTQNLVQLDGMLVYQPFHVLGFYSAFPSEIINHVDIYAGGFGSAFGERISSVIDVWSRNGNNRGFGGTAGISPFLADARIEGPLLRDRVSFLVSARKSIVEQAAESLVNVPLPYDFSDYFIKLHAMVGPTSRLSVQTLQTFDRGTLAEDAGGAPPEELRWRNEAYGMRYLMLYPAVPVTGDFRFSYSRLQSEEGPAEVPFRSTSIEDLNLQIDAMVHSEIGRINVGMAMRYTRFSNDLGGLFQDLENTNADVQPFSIYFEPEMEVGAYSIRGGVRLQFYDTQVGPYIEPRIRLVWQRGPHQISGAAGIYQQEVVGLVNRRDAASVFTVWTNIPGKTDPRRIVFERIRDDVRAGRVQRAFHGLLGYHITPTPGFGFSVEGFYKNLDNLFVPEWTAFPRLTTQLQAAEGRSYGLDLRFALQRGPAYAYLNYGFSNTEYIARQASLLAWYGSETLRYSPPHDRRHQINLMLGTSVSDFDISARWDFGSGLPFSQAIAFDGFVPVVDVLDPSNTEASRRVIYAEPYNARLPAYHRLDISVARSFTLGKALATVQASAMNVYDRRNVFYYDVFTLQRVDQLPFMPSLSFKVAFE